MVGMTTTSRGSWVSPSPSQISCGWSSRAPAVASLSGHQKGFGALREERRREQQRLAGEPGAAAGYRASGLGSVLRLEPGQRDGPAALFRAGAAVERGGPALGGDDRAQRARQR